MTSSWNMRIATLGPERAINLTPLWFGWAGGKVYFYGRGQKIANLRRTPSCTVLVDRNERFPELQGAMFHGMGVVLEDAAAEEADADLEEARWQMGRKYSGGHGEPARAGGREGPQPGVRARQGLALGRGHTRQVRHVGQHEDRWRWSLAPLGRRDGGRGCEDVEDRVALHAAVARTQRPAGSAEQCAARPRSRRALPRPASVAATRGSSRTTAANAAIRPAMPMSWTDFDEPSARPVVRHAADAFEGERGGDELPCARSGRTRHPPDRDRRGDERETRERVGGLTDKSGRMRSQSDSAT